MSMQLWLSSKRASKFWQFEFFGNALVWSCSYLTASLYKCLTRHVSTS